MKNLMLGMALLLTTNVFAETGEQTTDDGVFHCRMYVKNEPAFRYGQNAVSGMRTYGPAYGMFGAPFPFTSQPGIVTLPTPEHQVVNVIYTSGQTIEEAIGALITQCEERTNKRLRDCREDALNHDADASIMRVISNTPFGGVTGGSVSYSYENVKMGLKCTEEKSPWYTYAVPNENVVKIEDGQLIADATNAYQAGQFDRSQVEILVDAPRVEGNEVIPGTDGEGPYQEKSGNES